MSAERPRAARRADHDLFTELAVGWALHALEPEDEATLLRHLPDCRRCERDVAAATEVMAAMAGDLPQAGPPPGLRAALLADAEATAQLPVTDVLLPELLAPMPGEPPLEPRPRRSSTPPSTRPAGTRRGTAAGVGVRPRGGTGRPWQRWRPAVPAALAAVAVAAVVGLGAWNVYLSAARDDVQATAAADSQALAAVLVPGQATMAALADPHGQPMAMVVVHGPRIQVVTQGLAIDDTLTETYVLWGMRAGAPTALGTFDVGHPQNDVRPVGSAQAGTAGFTAYEISLEPGRQAPPTPTEIVATGQVGS